MAKALLPRQKLLARAYAATGNVHASEAAAGYRPGSGSAALRNPEVLAEVVREQQRKMVGDILPTAINTLHEILTDKGAPAGARVSAVKLAVEYTIGRPDSGVEKALDQMTGDEIAALLEETRLRRSELARVVDGEAEDVSEPSVLE